MSGLTISLVIPACQALYSPNSYHSAWKAPNFESLSMTVDWTTTATGAGAWCEGRGHGLRSVLLGSESAFLGGTIHAPALHVFPTSHIANPYGSWHRPLMRSRTRSWTIMGPCQHPLYTV